MFRLNISIIWIKIQRDMEFWVLNNLCSGQTKHLKTISDNNSKILLKPFVDLRFVPEAQVLSIDVWNWVFSLDFKILTWRRTQRIMNSVFDIVQQNIWVFRLRKQETNGCVQMFYVQRLHSWFSPTHVQQMTSWRHSNKVLAKNLRN